MLQKLPLPFAKVKPRNTYENLLNEILQIIYSLYREISNNWPTDLLGASICICITYACAYVVKLMIWDECKSIIMSHPNLGQKIVLK